MSLEKCQKYLYKLSNTNVNDDKFRLYLTKLNYWYEQNGGEKNFCKEFLSEKHCLLSLNNILEKISKNPKIKEKVKSVGCENDKKTKKYNIYIKDMPCNTLDNIPK